MDPERIPWRSGVRKACGSGAGSIESKAFESLKKKKKKKRKERNRTLPFPSFSQIFIGPPPFPPREYQHILILKKER